MRKEVTIRINPHLSELESDYLYHLGLSSTEDLKKIFNGAQYICMGGSPVRAEEFARKTAETLNIDVPIVPIGKTERYSLYLVGPVISVSHGMGMPSLSILLNEMTKLIHYSENKAFCYIRIGTSGGIGLEPGTVVISQNGLNAKLQPYFEQDVMGETRTYPTQLDPELAREIYESRGHIPVLLGNTIGTNDFYEGQGRCDGALPPDYGEKEKLAYLQQAYKQGARNMEMEASLFAAFCCRAGIPGAIICATLINRFNGDQATSTPQQLTQYSEAAQNLVLQFIKADRNTHN